MKQYSISKFVEEHTKDIVVLSPNVYMIPRFKVLVVRLSRTRSLVYDIVDKK